MNYAPKVTKTISYQTYRSKLMGQLSFHITSEMWTAWSHFRPSRFWADLWFDLKTWKSTAMTNSSYMMGHMPSENPWLVWVKRAKRSDGLHLIYICKNILTQLIKNMFAGKYQLRQDRRQRGSKRSHIFSNQLCHIEIYHRFLGHRWKWLQDGYHGFQGCYSTRLFQKLSVFKHQYLH